MGTYFIKKVSVVGYDYDCVVKINKEFFKPAYSVKVKVVGRLVKKKDIRISE